MSDIFDSFYAGPERRMAATPRRLKLCRRHRARTESLICECRSASSRRGDEEASFPTLYIEGWKSQAFSPK